MGGSSRIMEIEINAMALSRLRWCRRAEELSEYVPKLLSEAAIFVDKVGWVMETIYL